MNVNYNTGGNIKFDVVGHQADLRNFSTTLNSYLGYHGNGYGYQLNNSGNDYIVQIIHFQTGVVVLIILIVVIKFLW